MTKNDTTHNAHSHATRTADHDIYMDEDRSDNPKEYYKVLGSEIAKDFSQCESILDVGCATGELLRYFRNQALYNIL